MSVGEQRAVSKKVLFPEESYRIKGACIAVHEQPGCGFLEKVYENALAHELRKRGSVVRQRCSFQVFYDSALVGDYVANRVIDGRFIVEVKAVERDNSAHRAQLISYRKASGLPLGFLVNLGRQRFDFERVVYAREPS
jgi:GxxExxY protein